MKKLQSSDTAIVDMKSATKKKKKGKSNVNAASSVGKLSPSKFEKGDGAKKSKSKKKKKGFKKAEMMVHPGSVFGCSPIVGTPTPSPATNGDWVDWPVTISPSPTQTLTLNIGVSPDAGFAAYPSSYTVKAGTSQIQVMTRIAVGFQGTATLVAFIGITLGQNSVQVN